MDINTSKSRYSTSLCPSWLPFSASASIFLKMRPFLSLSRMAGLNIISWLLAIVNALIAVPPPASAIAACSAISEGTAETLSYPSDTLDPDYQYQKTHYWSAANADSTPACVVFPTTAREVSDIVLILQNYTDVEFSLKSGGHNPNVGFSSTDGGVLISFSRLATTTYSAETETAEIGPGARWGEVITALDQFGVAVVGGRIGMFRLFFM